MNFKIAICVGVTILVFHSAVRAQDSDSNKAIATAPVRIESQQLHNAIYLTDRIISGGLPEGDAAFAELKDLGIKTIISVDGATPNVELAKKYGLRYVHLPHGYDGISAERSLELAKAVRDLPGPIYVHCHHGKHRSPAAAATACRILGSIDAATAIEFLKTAGTSPNYQGLYGAVQMASPVGREVLDNLQVEYRETVPLPEAAETMVEIEQIFDRLIQRHREQANNKSELVPDLAHDALLLREQFTELLRNDDTQKEPADYKELARQAESLARDLENHFVDIRAGRPAHPDKIDSLLNALTQNCNQCHRKFRDVPLSDKMRKN